MGEESIPPACWEESQAQVHPPSFGLLLLQTPQEAQGWTQPVVHHQADSYLHMMNPVTCTCIANVTDNSN